MKALFLFAFIIATILFFPSCKKENMGDCFKKTGIVQRETRMLEDFDSLVLSNRINLILIEDTVNYAEIEAGSQLIDMIKTEIKHSRLEIENENKCNWSRSYDVPVNVYLHYNRLIRIVMYGSSTITNRDTLRADTLIVEYRDASGIVNLNVNNQFLNIIQHTGAGDAVVKGKTNALSVYTASLGYCDMRGLSASYVYVSSYSSADCYVYGTEEFDLQTHEDGSIYYTGPGSVNSQQRFGEGTISRVY